MCRPIRSNNRHRRAELWAQCKPHLFILASSRNVLFYFWYIIACMCIICVCMCGGGVEATGQCRVSFFINLHLLLWDKVSQWTQSSAVQTGWLVSEPRGPLVFVSSVLSVRAFVAMPGFLRGSLASKFRFSAYVAITVLTEPPPWIPIFSNS